jgi:hypothetical protein
MRAPPDALGPALEQLSAASVSMTTHGPALTRAAGRQVVGKLGPLPSCRM